METNSILKESFRRELNIATGRFSDIYKDELAGAFLEGFVRCWLIHTYGEIQDESFKEWFGRGCTIIGLE